MPTSIGILSIGEMGLGIAKLLRAHSFTVTTSLRGRAEATRKRAESAEITILETDVALVEESDVLLSIVPPRDAYATAERIIAAAKVAKRKQKEPLYFLDLNAVAPGSSRKTADALKASASIRFIDGGIVGGPPKEKNSNEWSKPSIVVSGPQKLQELQPDGERLVEVLNMRHVSPDIGTASGLKMTFASLTKGSTALAIQSFSTAYALGVLDDLKSLLDNHSPKIRELASNGLVSMPPKAWRWIEEMQEIATTMREDGGFEGKGGALFDEIAKVYGVVANDSLLGEEKAENRKRGQSVEDVAMLVRQGNVKRLKLDAEPEKS